MVMKKASKSNNYKILSAVLALALVIVLVYVFLPAFFYNSLATVVLPQLSTNGFVKTTVNASVVDQNTASITLSAECYGLTAAVEPTEAQSVIDGMNNQVGPRPNAHDLVRDVFSALKINVLMVKITQRQDSIYLAKIVLRQGNTILNYDIRPADGIAIAVRTKAPIYMNETLLKTDGTKIC